MRSVLRRSTHITATERRCPFGREGNVVVLVMIERNEVMFEGRDGPQPWVLRTTQVFRRSDRSWVRLHRHADPLILLRSLDSTLDLLKGA
jgi:hypothetical protein